MALAQTILHAKPTAMASCTPKHVISARLAAQIRWGISRCRVFRPVSSAATETASSNGTPAITGARPEHHILSPYTLAATAIPTPSPASGTTAVSPAPVPAPPLLAPAAVYATVVKGGAAKAHLPLGKAFVLAVLAGVYVSFGGLLSFTLLNAMPGLMATNPGLAKLLAAGVFPMGLALIIVCGAELFTGNTALLPAAVYEGQATWRDVLLRWAVVYAGNLVGCLGIVAAVAASGLMATNTVLPQLAVAKTSLPLTQALVRSVLCNWMVCLAVWMAMAASTLPGKLMGLWMPVTAFVTVGLEHSIANMFVVPMGMALGAPVSIATFITANLIPVTLGNIFAGAVCMAGTYALCYGRASEGAK